MQPEYKKKIDDLKDEMIKDLEELIKIRSLTGEASQSAPFGDGTYDALCFMLRTGSRDGFRVRNFSGYCGDIQYGDPEAEKNGVIGILCHLDVVPEGEGWTYAPFGAEIADNRMYGRGTSDDKGPTIAAYYAMRALKESGFEPKKAVRLIMGLDEETGEEKSLDYYKAHSGEPGFSITPDSDFPVISGEMGIMVFDIVKKLKKAEKGSIEIKNITGGKAYNMVPESAQATIMGTDADSVKRLAEEFSEQTGYSVSAKGRGKSVVITADGVSAHGARPWKGLNAVSVLMEFLRGISFGSSEFMEFLDFYHEHIGFDTHGERAGCALSDSESGQLIFNTGMAKLDGEAMSLTLNLRVPVTKTDEDVYSSMAEILDKYGIGIVKRSYIPPLYYAPDDERIKLLMDIYRRNTGDNESKPIVTGGGTYARYMKNAVAFGALFPGDPDLMHQKDEYIDLDRLVTMTRIYADFIYEFAVK